MAPETERAMPYQRFVLTENWAVLDKALKELVQNHDLEETTAHEYVVGYLCQALANPVARRTVNKEEIQKLVRAAQEEVRAANPMNRDLVAELLAERREEAARE